jgi:DNA mismatch repair protein MutL
VTARRPIRLMTPDLTQKIAAGEVIERPASAVKELLDNAIDAGARQVKVEIREAGLKLIRVTDDGHGIPGDELPLAFTPHATSKIDSLDDLEHLETLGFRGEALPSIAAVSRIDIQTHSSEDTSGYRYQLEYGSPTGGGVCSAPRGSRISVSELFSNVPARRKFIRSFRAESNQIQGVVTQYALAQPATRFSLTIDGRLTFQSPGTGRVADALAAVYGPDMLADMLVLDASESGLSISGLVSIPALTRQNRTAIHTFVNGRPVQNRTLGFVLEEAYSGFLMTGRHPMAVVYLSVPAGDVDVNVHPSKNEVRFARERDVLGALHRGVAGALLEMRIQTRELTDHLGSDIDAPSPLPQPMPLQDGRVQQTADSAPSPLMTGLSALRVFGQTNATFIIAEGPQGLYMIDQHAAHERILFDQLDQQILDGNAVSQPLLEPTSLELTPEQLAALETNGDLLMQVGFQLEPFGDSACLIRAVPALVRGGGPADLVLEVLDELQTLPEPGAAKERALAALACKAAVKAGQTLDVQEMRELVASLERTPRPSTCPHGRPTMIHLSHSQLEREFGRR